MLECSCNSFIYTLCVFVSLFLSLSLSLSLALPLSLSLSECVLCTAMTCVTRRVRIANHMVMGSRCRGGIVHIRCGCCRALLQQRHRPKALWRFRVSTSNSLIGRTRLPTYTHLCYIYHTYAQQDIRVYEDDLLKPPMRQYSNPKALSLLRVSI